MPYAKIINNSVEEYPLYLGDLEVLYGSNLPSEYVLVEDTPPPSIQPTEYLSEGEPLLQDGVWGRNWIVVEATPEQMQARLNPPAFARNRGMPLPAPSYKNFSGAMLADPDFNSVYAGVNATYPLLASSLPAALAQLNNTGDIEAFAMVFTPFIGVSSATPEQREGWADLAADANLPQEFIDIIHGTN